VSAPFGPLAYQEALSARALLQPANPPNGANTSQYNRNPPSCKAAIAFEFFHSGRPLNRGSGGSYLKSALMGTDNKRRAALVGGDLGRQTGSGRDGWERSLPGDRTAPGHLFYSPRG
jgi:hypothetical protein